MGVAEARNLPPLRHSLEAGRKTVYLPKQLLGTAQYKKLRSTTRNHASGTSPLNFMMMRPCGNRAFWDNIPPLIRNVPIAAAANGVMDYLESI